MSDEQIQAFVEFAATDRQTAYAFIKGSNGDLDHAISAYFDNPDPTRFKTNLHWDESSWDADRGGNRSQMQEVNPESFRLGDDGDNQLHSLTGGPGPTRPNSRASQRANRGSIDMEDADLEKAIAESKKLVPSNDDIPSRGQRQGRAPSPHPTAVSSEREMVPNVEAFHRTRTWEPAFLKPFHKPNLLPGLITILHTIPRCRYTLLAKQDTRLNYGENDQWFSGESIEVARTSIAGQDDYQEDLRDMIAEVQRLMAFLDKTTRAYGSADSLIRLPILNKEDGYSKQKNMAEKQAIRFLKAWAKASQLLQSPPNQPLFISTPSGGTVEDWFHIADIEADHLPKVESETIYDCLDRATWKGSNVEGHDQEACARPGAWLDVIAPVFIIRLPPKPRNGQYKPMTIPSSRMYADRYHISNKDQVLRMYGDMEADTTVIEEIDRKLAMLEMYIFKSSAISKPVKASDLLATTVSYFQEKQKTEIVDVASTEGGLSANDVLERLAKITTALQERTTALKQEKENAKNSMRQRSRLLGTPLGGDESSLRLRYHLYGVTTVGENHSEIYMRKALQSPPHASADPEALGDLDADWHRYSYHSQGRDSSALMVRQIITEAEVLEEVAKLKEDETTLLVYASDAMLDVSGLDVELPDALKDFVNTDNAAFQAELAQAEEVKPEIISGVPVMEEPPPYGPPTYDNRNMSYDGGNDEKITVNPNDTLVNNPQADVAMESVEGVEHVEHVTKIPFGEDDTEMTDVDI